MGRTLGIRANLSQFLLLVFVNALVGATLGLERSVLPALADERYGLSVQGAMLGFIAVFGLSKAITNYFAGRLSESWQRKHVLVLGWVFGLPVPFVLMWAPSWAWIIAANVLLGISQGLTWSTTVIMKIDLAGPKQRGLAMGLNESAGYLAVAVGAWGTAWLAQTYGLGVVPFLPGVVFVFLGLVLSIAAVKDTGEHVAAETQGVVEKVPAAEVFWRTSVGDPLLSSVSQAGLVNNLNDGLAWGLFPVIYASAGLSLADVGLLAALTPAVWGLGQLVTGALSDRYGRKGFIVAGMAVQAVALGVVALSSTFNGFAAGAILLGAGTAMVYPTLLAAIGDRAHPSWRASAIGIYRLWRDGGYAAGALITGVLIAAIGVTQTLWAVAILTALSGVVVAIRYPAATSEEGSAYVQVA